MNEHVKLYSGSSITVNRIASILEQDEIPSLVRNNEESARVAGFGVPQNSVELYVNESDLESAQAILKAFLKENQG